MSPSHPAAAGQRKQLLWFQCFVGLIPLLLLPAAWRMKPVWTLDHGSLLVLTLIAVGYVILVVTFITADHRGRRATRMEIVLAACAAFVPVLLCVLIFNPGFSKFAAVTSPILAIALLGIAFSIQGWDRSRLAIVTVLALIGIGLQATYATGLLGKAKRVPFVREYQLGTSLYELNVLSFRQWLPPQKAPQGGITKFGDHRFLAATGDGDLYLFGRSVDRRSLELKHLAKRVPMNSGEFATAMAGQPIALHWFRVADITAQVVPQGMRILASHHYWKSDQRCYVLRVSALTGSVDEIAAASPRIEWETVFDSTPCLPILVEGRAPKFEGIESGGRLALINSDQLLLSVGDHGLDGWGSEIRAAQDRTSSYGKTILINLNDRSSRVFTLGHRNPQGLIATKSGQLWSTEHGPEGGDELNLLVEGTNYGWPLATYGTDYGTHSWPLTTVAGSHDGFAQPYFSWVPSIAVSSLVEITSSRFERWDGDLIASSLKARELWRLRVRDQRVVLAERIPTDERIRQIIEGYDGELVLWSDRGTIMFIEPASLDAVSGQSLYRTCAGCHAALQDDARIAPSLRGIVGRSIAADPEFDYSAAMLTMGGVWTRERLDAFLTNPDAFVPGTSMSFAGIAEPAARAKLIDFLQSADRELDVSADQPP